MPTGDHELRAHFAYDGGGVAKGGTVSLFVDDDRIGEGRVERTIPFQFTFDETVDVGCDLASPVSPDYAARGNEFSGELRKLSSRSATTTTRTSSTTSTASTSRC